MFPNCLPLSFPFVPRSTLIGASYPCVSQSLACNHHSYPASIRTLKGPHGARCTLGFDLKPGPHHNRDGAWLVGCCHLIGDLQGSGHFPQLPEQGEWMSFAANLSDNESASAVSKDLLFTGFCLFAIASVNFYGTWLDPAYAAVACAVLGSAPV